MATNEPTTVTIPLNLTPEEARDLAVLCHRIKPEHLNPIAWRGAGDTAVTVGRWITVLDRIGGELARAGYHIHARPAEGE
jgi:hypothetical protein